MSKEKWKPEKECTNSDFKEHNCWAFENFGIDVIKDIENFLKEVKEDRDFQDFLEIQKRLKNEHLRSLLGDLVFCGGRGIEYYFEFMFNEMQTIFNLKDAFDSYKSLIYYLVDDECLVIAEIDYEWKSSFTIEEKTTYLHGNDKTHILCTGLWNTSLSDYDFFIKYLQKEIKERQESACYDNIEVTKVNKIRYHNFNTVDGVKDFTSFIKFLDDEVKSMVDEYEKDKMRAEENEEDFFFFAKPSYLDRCNDIVKRYLNSTTTRDVTRVMKGEQNETQSERQQREIC